MSKITYTNKVALNENADIPNINKVTDNDMNEIKTVVNNNDDELTTINTNLMNATTYSTDEIRIGTWIDGKPIYRKVFDRGTSIESFAHNISNISNIWINNDYSVRIHTSGNCIPLNGGTSSASLITSCYVNSTTVTINVFDSSISPSQVYVTLEYTKTTD